MQTLQQERAKYALDQVTAALSTFSNQRKEFRNHAAGLPAMILMNGLGQAAAFCISQDDVHNRLYTILSGWLTGPNQPYENSGDLLAGITEQDLDHYRIAQTEALLLLDWVCKFAKAFVREEE
jgi:CRISPR-associated protein Cmr5